MDMWPLGIFVHLDLHEHFLDETLIAAFLFSLKSKVACVSVCV